MPLPDDEDLAIFSETLLEGRRLAYLLEDRMWAITDIERFQIGWYYPWERYLIPQRDQTGQLVNVRMWRTRSDKGARWLHWPGHGNNARAWPIGPLLRARTGSCVYICAGEPDAMAAMAQGALALTGPGGEGRRFNDKDIALLAGFCVHIVYDSDATGRAGAGELEHQVRGALRVHVHDLFPDNPDRPPKGTPRPHRASLRMGEAMPRCWKVSMSTGRRRPSGQGGRASGLRRFTVESTQRIKAGCSHPSAGMAGERVMAFRFQGSARRTGEVP